MRIIRITSVYEVDQEDVDEMDILRGTGVEVRKLRSSVVINEVEIDSDMSLTELRVKYFNAVFEENQGDRIKLTKCIVEEVE